MHGRHAVVSTDAVVLHDVTVGYRFAPVFAHLSLTIPRGAFVGLVGPTGAGKTTLLKTILGIVPPTFGTALLDGRPAGRQRPGSVGFVPQGWEPDRGFPLTVEQVILMGLPPRSRLAPWFAATERRRARQVAARLGIDACLGHHVADISGGQLRRALLARALVSEPALLVLDEPTAAVDPGTQQEILDLLLERNRAGVTIVMSTHDLELVAAHLPRLVCLDRRIVADGAPGEVLSPALVDAVFGPKVVAATRGPASPEPHVRAV
jgi:zinc/manganese transport system ATP-binding protein/zinc transport system ATP-binding protein